MAIPAAILRPRRPPAILLLAWILLCAVAALAAGEVFVRWRGNVDADGTFHYGGKPIAPWAMPVAWTRSLLEEYAASPNSYLRYDAELGWSPRPASSSRDGLYRANLAGLRAPREYDLSPPKDKVRIVLLGDSFMHGDDVPWEASLAANLEAVFHARGIDVEVLNFGVGGYGFDQALLRWRRDARLYRPDLVVQGLQLENTARNVNLLRVLYYPPTVIPFSKPRFTLESGRLEALNVPTLAIERIVPTLERFHDWELARYETFYDAREYAPRWWSASKLACLAAELARRGEGGAPSPQKETMRLDSEAFALTKAILSALRSEVRAAGASLHLLDLPTGPEAAALEKRGTSGRAAMRKAVCAEHDCIDPSDAIVDLLRSKGMRAAYTPQHLTAAANRAVAETLATRLIPTPEAATPLLQKRGQAPF